MSKPQDFFGQSPKTVLNKPFFHAQDQKAYNVDGGTSVADAWTKRTLNTVITNDIQGASLASDQVSLPAGTYYVEGEFVNYIEIACGVAPAIFKDSVKQIQGKSRYHSASSTIPLIVSGVVTLASPGVIDLRYYAGLATPTSGLGQSNNAGSITDASISSIYADLKIWQLDRSLEIAPKAVNSGLQTIAGMNTEGDIMGADVTVSGNVLTVTKGSCMSSDLTTAMAVTADTTVTLPSTVNQDFYIFMVRLVADGTFTYKAYTTYAGPSSDGLVDKWRFVSYAKNNGSGVTMPYKQFGDILEWTSADMPQITSSMTVSFVSYGLNSVVPNIIWKQVKIYAATTSGRTEFSFDGTTVDLGIDNTLPGTLTIPSVSSIYIRYSAATTSVKFRGLLLRR